MIYQVVKYIIYGGKIYIRFKTSKLRLDLYDYHDAYIVVKRTITVKGDDDNKKSDKKYPLRSQNTFFCMKLKNTVFFFNIKL